MYVLSRFLAGPFFDTLVDSLEECCSSKTRASAKEDLLDLRLIARLFEFLDFVLLRCNNNQNVP